MRYFQIDKGNGKKKEISRKRVLEVLKMNYRNPEDVLEQQEGLPENLNSIDCSFSIIEIKTV